MQCLDTFKVFVFAEQKVNGWYMRCVIVCLQLVLFTAGGDGVATPVFLHIIAAGEQM